MEVNMDLDPYSEVDGPSNRDDASTSMPDSPTPKKQFTKKMPAKRVDWSFYNFKELYSPTGVKRSLCLKCGRDFARTDYKFFGHHQDICKGPESGTKKKSKQRSQKNKENNINSLNAQTFSNQSSDIIDNTMDVSDTISDDALNELEAGFSTHSVQEGYLSRSNSVSTNDVAHHTPVLKKSVENALTFDRSASMDSDKSMSNKHKIQMDTYINILKYMLSEHIDLKSIESIHAVKMFSSLNIDFVPPSAKFFETVVMDKAKVENYNFNRQKKSKNVIELLTYAKGSLIYALTTLLCEDDQDIYLQFAKFERPTTWNEKFEEEIIIDNIKEREWLLNICRKSIQVAAKSYNAEVRFVLHDGRFDLKQFDMVDMYPDRQVDSQRSYVLFKSMHLIVKKVLDVELPTTSKKRDLIANYDLELEKLIRDAEKVSLSEFTHMLLDFSNNNSLLLDNESSKEIFQDAFLEVMTPMYLLAKCLNPKFHGSYVRDDAVLNAMLSKFITSAVVKNHIPHYLLDGLGYYLDKDDCIFVELFEGKVIEDPCKFWIAVKIHRKYRPLSEFALDLLNVPSHSRNLNMEDIICKLERYPEVDCDGFRALLYSLA